MLNARLFMIQRLTAMVMAPLVTGHLIVMIYAIRGGLTSAEILGRTQGSLAWGLFYGAFVIAVSIHAAIGLRVIAHETLRLKAPWLEALTWIIGLMLLSLGGYAVAAVTFP